MVVDNVSIDWDYVVPPPPEDQPPIAKFTFDPEKPRVGENIHFDSGDSDDPDGTIVSYEWDFGNASTTGMQVTHTYNEAGNYTVNLTVTDNDGLTNSINQTVTIGPYISSIDPSSGAPGITMTIEGWNFDDIPVFQYVTFGSNNADTIEWTDNQIIVRVPHGEGTVDVIAGPWPESNSVPFTYKAPIIHSIYPSSGRPNTEVTIEGENFGDRGLSPTGDYVKFGKSLAFHIMSWSDNKIVLRAPSDYGTGLSDRRFLIWILRIAVEGYEIPIPDILKDDIYEIIADLLLGGVEVLPGEGEIRVTDIRVTTSAGTSNAVAFTYEVRRMLRGEAHCPVDLEITDPDGLILDKNGSEIPKAFYLESDINGDGEIFDLFGIPDPIPGLYLIQVIPEPNALPGDKYSLEIYYDGKTQILADQVLVSDIPPEPYIVSVIDKEFMITFDDGPIEGKTENILNQIKAINVANEPVKAGFFMVGDNDPHYHAEYELWPEKGSVKKNPNIAKMVAGLGHIIGNHTLSHPWFGWYGSSEKPELESRYKSLEEFVRDEIVDCDSKITEALGVTPTKIFRPSYMYNSPEVYDAAEQSGFDVVWGKYAGDSNPFITSAEAIKKKSLQILRSWKEDEPCVLIFHDNQPVTYNHIGEIIEYLQIKGFTLAHFDPQRIPKQIGIKAPSQAISGVVNSPVDLQIIDPNGSILSKEENQIAYGLYEEIDVNEDSEIDDFFVIPDPIPGQYLIYVIPEPNASPGDTYSLTISYGEKVIVFAEKAPISEIPIEPFTWTVQK